MAASVSRRPSRQWGSSGAPASRCAERSRQGAARGARALRSRSGERGSSARPPRRSPRRSRPTCNRRRRQRARRRTAARAAGASRRRGGRRTSASRAGRRRPLLLPARLRAGASCGRSCCPSGRRATSERTIQARSPAAASPWSFERAVGGQGVRAVGLDVRLALAAVEDVVRRVVDDRSAERDGVRRPADIDRGRALGIVLGTVDVRPGSRVQDELGPGKSRGRRQRDVPVGV